jgi:hypothetical protein
MNNEDDSDKDAIPWYVKPEAEKILFEKEESLSCRRIFGAYREALPAMVKVLGQIDQRVLDMMLFKTLDETRPGEQAVAIQKLTRSLVAVIDRVRPVHNEGATPGKDPTTLIRALIAALRVGTMLEPDPEPSPASVATGAEAGSGAPRPPRDKVVRRRTRNPTKKRVGKYPPEMRARVLELASVVEPRRWLQWEIAELLGVSQTYVSDLLGPRKGREMPDPTNGAGGNTATKPN